MTKHIKPRRAGIVPAAETRSDLTGADYGQGNTAGTQRRHLGIAIKQPMLQSVSAVERLRIWLLKQAWFHSVLLPALPRQLRWILRKMYLAPVDLADRLIGRHDPELPPKAHMFTGAPLDFAASGRRTLKTICSITDANPSSHILDIGCGIGRLAIAMPDFLDTNGGYEGFDIVPEGIEWCKQHIVGPYDNIHFTLATSTTRSIIRRVAGSQLIINFLMRTRPSMSPYFCRCSRTCCQLTLTDMSVRSRVYSKRTGGSAQVTPLSHRNRSS